MEPPIVVILLGAGAGRRLGDTGPKAFLPIGDRSMLAVAAAGAAACRAVTGLVVAVPPGWEERGREALEGSGKRATIVAGGDDRQASVRACLAHLPEDARIVVVHDAARPFASPDLFARVLAAMDGGADAVIPVLPVTDTLIRVRAGLVAGTESRDELSLVQTPQAFRAGVLREAHAKAEASGFTFTDDATMLQWAGFQVRTVPGEPGNTKVTHLGDLAEADRRMGEGDG